MFNPLPAIALLPLALGAYAGFQAVPEALRMADRNYGLSGLRLVLHILVPTALPSILAGRKIGWAFASRTLIAVILIGVVIENVVFRPLETLTVRRWGMQR